MGALSRADRPRVVMNMATSIDGKIATADRSLFHFGSAEDRARMEELRAAADAVMIGSGTFRAEDPSLTVREPDRIARRKAAKGSEQPLGVVVSTKLPDDADAMQFFREPGVAKAAFTTDATPADVRERLAPFACVEVVPEGPDGHPDLPAILRRLHELGVEDLLLEGGGHMNFSMLREGLVDEIYQTVCPFVFGGRGAASMVGGEGFSGEQVKKLTLLESKVGGRGEIFLHYRVDA